MREHTPKLQFCKAVAPEPNVVCPSPTPTDIAIMCHHACARRSVPWRRG